MREVSGTIQIMNMSKCPNHPSLRIQCGQAPDVGHLRADLDAVRGDGPLAVFRLELPPIAEACYFAPLQKNSINPSLDLWPEAYNQSQPLVVPRLADLKWGGLFTMARLADGRFLALLPLVTGELMTWLRGDVEGLLLELDHWGTGGLQAAAAPLLAWAVAGHPYAAVDLAWEEAAAVPEVAANLGLRREKQFPEIFEYLGWCSWEEFHWHIGEDVLVGAFRELTNSGVPVRWVLVDDGHLDETGGFPPGTTPPPTEEGEVPAGEEHRRLRSLDVYRPHFPHGWDPVVEAARTCGFRWLGVWLNFNGYWGGIAAKNELGDINEGLTEVSPGTLQPRPGLEHARKFYDALVAAQQVAGFDFLKVDNQAKNLTFYQQRVPNAVVASSSNHAALEGAADARMQAMINCMAHNNLCHFHTRHSAVTRCSEDYKKGDLWRAKHHLNNSFANMLWMRGTTWGDHDMFHSSDPVAAEVMARSKAVSGGPIYLSDAPREINRELVARLCLADGRILRTAEPALPAPESIFIDSYCSDRAFRALAPINRDSAVVVAYNLTSPEIPVRGAIGYGDFADAMRLLPGSPELSGPIAVFRWHTREARKFEPGGSWEFEISRFGDEMFWLAKVHGGWGVLGRADKFLGPAAATLLEATPGLLRVRMLEQGPLLVWSDQELIHSTRRPQPATLGDGLWLVDLPVTATGTEVVLTTQ